jgi:hypothetical protein
MTSVPPFVIYTNIYTLEGTDPKSNKYIDMYLLWLTNIIKYGNIQKTDVCVTYMDEETYAYINVYKTDKNILFQTLKKQIDKFVIIKYVVPANHKEGMLRKYAVDTMIEYTKPIHAQNPIYMYLDVDVLVVKDIRKLTLELNKASTADDKTTLFLRNELNLMTHADYFGELMTDADKQTLNDREPKLSGFSAGIFGWCNNINIKQFLDQVLILALKSDKKLYTIEQPFFNAALFHYMHTDISKFIFLVMDRAQIAQNEIGVHLSDNNVLVNYCGEPGNQSAHWDKLYHQLLSQLLFTEKI